MAVVFGIPEAGGFLSLVLNGVPLSHTELACTLKVVLYSWFLFEEQVTTMAKGTFAQLHPMQDSWLDENPAA